MKGAKPPKPEFRYFTAAEHYAMADAEYPGAYAEWECGAGWFVRYEGETAWHGGWETEALARYWGAIPA